MVLTFYLTTRGRISRKATWLAVLLPITAVSIVAGLTDSALWPDAKVTYLGMVYTPVATTLFVILLWPTFATSIRRFHDLNMTGWWVITSIPFFLWLPDFSNFFARPVLEQGMIAIWVISTGVAMLLGLAQLFVPGTHGANRFGLDPLSRSE